MIGKVEITNPPKDDKKLIRYLASSIGAEITNISKPCYSPKVIKYKTDLLHLLGVSGVDIKYFLKNLDSKYSRFDIFSDQYTISIIISMIYFSQNKKPEISKLLFHFLAIKFYSSLFHISFPRFCSDFLWNKTMDKISSKHLFREKNGAANALNYLVDILFDKYEIKISKETVSDYDLVRMVYDLRHRLSQSIKSFAELYYSTQKKDAAASSTLDIDESESDNLSLLSDKISMSICTYSTVDQDALKFAITKSGFKKEIATTIINEISDVDYKEQLKFILILIGKVSTYKYICRDAHRNTMIRKVAINNEKVGNYVVSDEIFKFLKNTKLGYTLQGYQKRQVIIFFMHYVLKYIQRKICGNI